jgi:hypothetical protein
MPVSNPTVATPVDPELHVPPLPALLRVVVSPIHTLAGPVIADGNELTVTVAVDEQPVPCV